LDPAVRPLSQEHTEYGDHCLAGSCVVDAGVPVEDIYREEPDMAKEGDVFPDSGWRIRGQQNDARAGPCEGRKMAYLALGAVLNRDDSFIGLLDQPIGSAFMRNFAVGGYDLCD
jgi:hypothetical protein